MIEDLAVIAGLGCVAFGCYEVAPWLAWVVGGISLTTIGLAVSRSKRKEAKKK